MFGKAFISHFNWKGEIHLYSFSNIVLKQSNFQNLIDIGFRKSWLGLQTGVTICEATETLCLKQLYFKL